MARQRKAYRPPEPEPQKQPSEYAKQPVPKGVGDVPDPPPLFQVDEGVYVHNPNLRGRVSAIEPLHAHPGIKLAFILPRHSDPATWHEYVNLRKYKPLTPEQCTTDMEEALATDKVCFVDFTTTPEGFVQVGPYIPVWTPKRAWLEAYHADLRRIEEAGAPPGVKVEENQSVPVEV